MVWHRATCHELARSELVEIVEGSEVVSTSMVKILNPLFSHRGTEAQRFFHHEEMKGTKKVIKLIFSLASCSVETNPFEKVVLSQTLFRKLLSIFIQINSRQEFI